MADVMNGFDDEMKKMREKFEAQRGRDNERMARRDSLGGASFWLDSIRRHEAQAPKTASPGIEKADRSFSAGYFQGACECANIVKKHDLGLGQDLLRDMGVTKNKAREFAKPETYAELKKDLFAPKQELSQSRGMSR